MARNDTGRPSSARGRRSGRPAEGANTVGREVLIERTCELLRVLPPQQVTREAVARHANVHPSLIKYYFRNRASLITAAVERLVSQTGDAAETATRAGLGPTQSLIARMAALLNMHVENPLLLKMFLGEVLAAPDLYEELVEGTTTRSGSYYRRTMAEGVAKGELREVDEAFLNVALIGMCGFFVAAEPILRQAKGPDATAKSLEADYRRFITDLLLDGLRPRNQD